VNQTKSRGKISCDIWSKQIYRGI